MSVKQFDPGQRRLMGPGPSDVPPRVLSALARPTIGHLDPAFQRLMDQIMGLLRQAFRTTNRLTIPLSAPGSAGMEAAFVNLLEPGDTVIIARNGVFGERMRANAERCRARAVMVDADWGRPVDPDAVARAFEEAGKVKALAFVHAETSTGARSDAAALAAIAREHGALTIADCVTSLGGIDVDVDGWGLDFVYSGTQKCLSCPPGLSPITLSARAADAIRARKTPVQSWFLDLGLVMAYWDGQGGRTYHHTAPVNALYGLHEALVLLMEEGLEASWARHARAHAALAAGLEAMGLEFLVEAGHRLPQLNAVKAPAGVDEAAVRQHLLRAYDLEIGAGLGPLAGKVWRIGLMGHSARLDNVVTCLAGMEEALTLAQAQITPGRAVAAAQAAWAAGDRRRKGPPVQ